MYGKVLNQSAFYFYLKDYLIYVSPYSLQIYLLLLYPQGDEWHML